LENAQKSPPNIVLILTDDQGYGDLKLHGNENIDTPTMDRFAETGVEFGSFYVSPLCAPTRASLLTGRYHPRTGVLTTEQNFETLNANELTIAQGLKNHGYKTACFGKWHNGCFYPHTPMGMGFDEFLGFYGGFFQNYFDATLINHKNQEIQTEGFITDVLTDYAIDFIQRHKNQCFFCYVPYNACHTPIQCPDELFKKYRKRGFDNYNAGIYAMLENADSNIQRILNALDELGLTSNTIVIFLSDNGANMSPPLFTRFNSGLRGFKGTVHEGGNRVPMFIQWKGHIEPGKKIGHISAHIDIFPTLFELCGLEIPKSLPLDGKSLVPLIRGYGVHWPERALFTHIHILKLANMIKKSIPIIRGMIGEYFKNFWRIRKNPKIKMHKGAIKTLFIKKKKEDILIAPGAIRTPRYRLEVFLDKDELYDILEDPCEINNLIDKRPRIASELRKKYNQWFYSITPENQEYKKKPILIGYEKARLVQLPAIHAKFYGKLNFAGYGFYYDWISNWKREKDFATWDIEVVHSGKYEISLKYFCKKKYIGSTIVIEIGGQSIKKILDTPFKSKQIKRNDRVIRVEQYERTWGIFPIGSVSLQKGLTILKIYAKDIPKKHVIDLFSIIIERK